MDTMSVTLTRAGAATSIAEARESARRFLEDLLPAVAAGVAEKVVMVVSELVTNALRHGGGAYTLHLSGHPDTIEVAVGDLSPRMPRMRTPDLVDGTGGFGWRMVNDLAHHVVVTPGPQAGKTVRAFLSR
ncbi:ATP-binding protein [Streptomyces subrutilus]|uniref:ATP-binding protein n=1 Tax=Streptomyces subrutilus TaxID=36818 RepID=UPI0033E4FFCC